MVKVANYLSNNRKALKKFMDLKCDQKNVRTDSLAIKSGLKSPVSLDRVLLYKNMSKLSEFLPKFAKALHVSKQDLDEILFDGNYSPLDRMLKVNNSDSDSDTHDLAGVLQNLSVDKDKLRKQLNIPKNKYSYILQQARPSLKLLIRIALALEINPYNLCFKFNYSTSKVKKVLKLIKERNHKKMISNINNFGQYLHHLRISHKYSLQDVATHAKTSVELVSMYEKNNLHRMHLSFIFNIANLYNIDPDTLMKKCPKFRNVKSNDNEYKLNYQCYIHHLSCPQMAKKCGVGVSTFYRLSRGQKTRLTPSMEKRITSHLHLPSNYLTPQFYQRHGFIPDRPKHNLKSTQHYDHLQRVDQSSSKRGTFDLKKPAIPSSHEMNYLKQLDQRITDEKNELDNLKKTTDQNTQFIKKSAKVVDGLKDIKKGY